MVKEVSVALDWKTGDAPCMQTCVKFLSFNSSVSIFLHRSPSCSIKEKKKKKGWLASSIFELELFSVPNIDHNNSLELPWLLLLSFTFFFLWHGLSITITLPNSFPFFFKEVISFYN